jgi:hypothetical protein
LLQLPLLFFVRDDFLLNCGEWKEAKKLRRENLINKTFLWNFPIFHKFFERKTIPSLCCPFSAFNFTVNSKPRIACAGCYRAK